MSMNTGGRMAALVQLAREAGLLRVTDPRPDQRPEGRRSTAPRSGPRKGPRTRSERERECLERRNALAAKVDELLRRTEIFNESHPELVHWSRRAIQDRMTLLVNLGLAMRLRKAGPGPNGTYCTNLWRAADKN